MTNCRCSSVTRMKSERSFDFLCQWNACVIATNRPHVASMSGSMRTVSFVLSFLFVYLLVHSSCIRSINRTLLLLFDAWDCRPIFITCLHTIGSLHSVINHRLSKIFECQPAWILSLLSLNRWISLWRKNFENIWFFRLPILRNWLVDCLAMNRGRVTHC